MQADEENSPLAEHATAFRFLSNPLPIVRDRLPAYLSRLVREFIELSEGHIVTEYLPAYTPELNPVE